jgi:hypothetical protein
MVDYVYSLSSDFGGEIASSAFFDEIIADIGVTQNPESINVIGDVVTITFALALSGAEQTALDNLVAVHPAVCKSGIVFGSTFSDILTFGSNANNLQNAFLLNGANSASSDSSAPLAESNGQVVFASLSSAGTANYFIDIVINAFSGQSGTYSGGTVIGSIEKTEGGLDQSFNLALTPFPFTKGDRISAYLRKGTGGGAKPLIRLFLEYTN